MPLKHLLAACLLPLAIAACSDSNNGDIPPTPEPPEPEPEPTLSAEIRRTEYGIPHIKADDWESLGYGFGYAYAQDNFCVTMREIVFASGRSAALMGEDMGSVDSDFLFTYLNGDREAFQAEFIDALPQFARDLAAGFTAGMNRYLDETGVDNLPEGDLGCRGADWVYAFDVVDYFYYLRREALRGSSDQGLFRNALHPLGQLDSLDIAINRFGSLGDLRPRVRVKGFQLAIAAIEPKQNQIQENETC